MSAATTAGFDPAPKCKCRRTCGDVAEKNDHPRAVCKALPIDPSREAKS